MAFLIPREVQVVLHHHIPALQLKPVVVPGNLAYIKNRQDIAFALSAISNVPSLQFGAAALLAHPMLKEIEEQIPHENHVQNFKSSLDAFGAQANTILKYLDASLPKAPELYFSFVLPADDEIVRVASDINAAFIAFDNPVRRVTGTQLSVTSFQSGSLVAEIAGNQPAMVLVGSIITMATGYIGLQLQRLAVEKAKIALEKTREETRGAVIKNDGELIKNEGLKLENEKKRIERDVARLAAREHTYKIDVEETIERILAEKVDNETANSIEEAVRECAELRQRDGDIRLQLNPPLEVEESWPEDARPGTRLLPRKDETQVKQLPPKKE